MLHGLLRVRGLTMDDGHLFVREDQISDEIAGCMTLALDMLALFGFKDFDLYLATRPESFMGEPAAWDRAEAALRAVLEKTGRPFQIDEGGGAFYGPKIDLKIKDALGREWQCSTFQLDFQLPERFQLEYVATDGTRQRPIMIHRALLGSMERFIAVLIEHFAGAFPLWLAPVQAKVLSVSEKAEAYANEVVTRLRAEGLRVEADLAAGQAGRQDPPRHAGEDPVHAGRRGKGHGGAGGFATHPRGRWGRWGRWKGPAASRSAPGRVRRPPARGSKNPSLRILRRPRRHYNDGSLQHPELTQSLT